VRYHFAISLAQELPTVGDQLIAQRLEILDDPIVDERNAPGDVRVRIAHGRSAVRGPTRVRDTDDTVQRLLLQFAVQVLQLAFGTPALKSTLGDGADAG
jgi:hypothetical protein